MSNSTGCQRGECCTEVVVCDTETCQYGMKGWKHAAEHIRHICAHDFSLGPVIEIDNGFTRTCICGMTAISHDMRYAP